MKPARILLVEDNPADRDLTRDTLEETGLCLEVRAVGDGAEAVRYLDQVANDASRRPNLVLLDMNLPKLDGRGVLVAIRSCEALRMVPVVMLSSSDASVDIVDSYALGANCYVTKPSDLASFQAAVRSISGFWLTVVKLP